MKTRRTKGLRNSVRAFKKSTTLRVCRGMRWRATSGKISPYQPHHQPLTSKEPCEADFFCGPFLMISIGRVKGVRRETSRRRSSRRKTSRRKKERKVKSYIRPWPMNPQNPSPPDSQNGSCGSAEAMEALELLEEALFIIQKLNNSNHLAQMRLHNILTS